jgi:hypothetical protein
MGGLADALAMQGRRGDSTLVHMNPMEVRMLETMSPDGRLSINPETGLPEAFKLKDIAAFALPIAASIAFPMLAPAGLRRSWWCCDGCHWSRSWWLWCRTYSGQRRR